MYRDPDQREDTYWIIGTVHGGGWSCGENMFHPINWEDDVRGGVWNSVPAQMEWIDKTLKEEDLKEGGFKKYGLKKDGSKKGGSKKGGSKKGGSKKEIFGRRWLSAGGLLS